MAYDPLFMADIFPLLNRLFDTYLSDIWDGRLYSIVRPVNSVLPAGVYQSQDGGGKRKDTLNANGWEGLITFRAIGFDDNENWLRIKQVAALLPTMEDDDYSIKVTIDKPMPFPVDRTSAGTIYTAGLIVKMAIYKKE